MAINWKSLLSTAAPLLAVFGSTAVSGKLAKYNTVAQTALKSAVTKVDNGVDELQAAYTSYSTANPVVAEALSQFKTLASSAGIYLPSMDVVETHIKAAIADLAGTFTQPTSAS